MCLSVCACVSTYSYEVIKLKNIRRINIYIYDEHVPYQSREKEKKTRLPRAFAHRSKNTKITGHHDAQKEQENVKTFAARLSLKMPCTSVRDVP